MSKPKPVHLARQPVGLLSGEQGSICGTKYEDGRYGIISPTAEGVTCGRCKRIIIHRKQTAAGKAPY